MTAHHLRNRGLAFWLVTLAACVGIALTAGLGRWQLARAAQKETIAADMASRASATPLSGAQLERQLTPLPSGAGLGELLYRPVQLRGHWLSRYTVFLDNRSMGGRPGFIVLTPLELAGGTSVVLVQRGWIPRNILDRTALAAVDTPAGEVEITGHLAPGPGQNFSLGSGRNEPGFLRIRQNLRLADFRAETGLRLASLAVVQEGPASQGLLRDWAPVSSGVEKNYGYAFQWFALCCLILGLYVWFQFVRPRSRA